MHVCDAERAFRAGDPAGAYQLYEEAGACAERYGLWRTALRCYRNAVEVDLFAPAAVRRLAAIASRAGAGLEWAEYATALARTSTWPRVTCRGMQILIGTNGAVAACSRIGSVLELLMTDADLVEVMPDTRFADIPVAMALLLLRRAMWPVSRDDAASPFSVRVTYRGRARYRLFENADWAAL